MNEPPEPSPPYQPRLGQPTPPIPPVTGAYVDRDHDPLAAHLLSTQPKASPHPVGSRMPLRTKLLIAVPVIAVLIIIANLVDLGTPIRSLDVGDCFETPSSRTADRVDLVDCETRHGGQVYGIAGVLRSEAEQTCAEIFEQLDRAEVATLPADATGWIMGSTFASKRCVIVSSSEALVGSLTD